MNHETESLILSAYLHLSSCVCGWLTLGYLCWYGSSRASASTRFPSPVPDHTTSTPLSSATKSFTGAIVLRIKTTWAAEFYTEYSTYKYLWQKCSDWNNPTFESLNRIQDTELWSQTTVVQLKYSYGKRATLYLFVFSYQVSVTHMCGRRAKSERRGSTANCDWRLPLSTETNQIPAKRQD